MERRELLKVGAVGAGAATLTWSAQQFSSVAAGSEDDVLFASSAIVFGDDDVIALDREGSEMHRDTEGHRVVQFAVDNIPRPGVVFVHGEVTYQREEVDVPEHVALVDPTRHHADEYRVGDEVKLEETEDGRLGVFTNCG